MENLAYLEKKLIRTSWKWILGGMLDTLDFMSSSLPLHEICIAVFVGKEIARRISCQMANWRLQGQPRDIQLALGSGSNGRHRGTYDARLQQRFRAEQYFNCMVSVLEEMSDASTRYFLSFNNCTSKNCVLVSGLKASKSKLIKTKVVFILRELEV